MKIIRVTMSVQCDCGKKTEGISVGLIRGGESPVACECGFSLTVSAAKEKPTRLGINIASGEAKVLQVGDDESDPPLPH